MPAPRNRSSWPGRGRRRRGSGRAGGGGAAGCRAAQAAEEIGYPVALKIESPAIRHKTEAKALRLDVAGRQEVLRAFQEVVTEARRHAPEADIHGVLVQEMVRDGTEVVVGVHHDPQFGPVVMVGLGGIFVEVLEDVSFRAAPLSREDAEQMVAELRGARVLEGVRGRPPADVPSLIDALLAVSRLAADTAGEIAELDVNPLLVLPGGRGAVAVGALTVLAEPGTGSP